MNTQEKKNKAISRAMNSLCVIILGADKTVSSVLGLGGAMATVQTMAQKSITDLSTENIAKSLNEVEELKVEKKWVHEMYKSVEVARASHSAIDGEIVDITAKFSVGYNPRTSTNPKNTYNCSCGFETIYGGETFKVEEVFIRKQFEGNAGITFKAK